MNAKSWLLLRLSFIVVGMFLLLEFIYQYEISYILIHKMLFFGKLFRKKSLLDSGWDKRAFTLFEQTLKELSYHNRTRSITFPVTNITAKVLDTHSDFWNHMEKGVWERSSFAVFSQFITSSTIVIDVGTWIGPTILFNAQLASKTYGIEADPVAYARTFYNLKCNAQAPWYDRVHLQPGCLDIKSRLQQMKSASPGNSMSSLSKIYGEEHHRTTVNWTVRCYALSDFFNAWDINSEVMDVFIKIDIESYECQVLPSLYPWLANMKRKPSIFIAMHQQITACSNDQYNTIVKLASLYRFRTKSFINEKGVVQGTGEFVLSDIMMPL